MRTIKIIAYSLIALIGFAALYISLENQHEYQVLKDEVKNLKFEQEKLEYLVENQSDTVIISINNKVENVIKNDTMIVKFTK